MKKRYLDVGYMVRRRIGGLIVALGIAVEGATAFAAEPIYIDPLFEYPVAPEELPDLQSKTDYLMQHFWDAMDFNNPASVNQAALNHAFGVYTQAMPYADRDEVLKSVAALTKKIRGNAGLTLQFAKAAEESLYGNRATLWSDEVYIPFLREVISNKSISASRKARYQNQYELLKNTALGMKFPKLRVTLRNGRQMDYQPKCQFTLLEIGNPDCDDCRFARMKIDMASDLQDMLAAGELEILFLVADAMPEDQPELLKLFENYPENWTPAISYGADDKLDIRRVPSFYLLDKDGKILAKNLDVTEAVSALRDAKEKSMNPKKSSNKADKGDNGKK